MTIVFMTAVIVVFESIYAPILTVSIAIPCTANFV